MRLLLMLRPYHGMIALGMLLLILLSRLVRTVPGIGLEVCDRRPDPCRQVSPDAVLHVYSSRLTGRFTGKLALLFSSMLWLVVVYAVGEADGDAQHQPHEPRRTEVHPHSSAIASITSFNRKAWAISNGSARGDLMSRAMGDVDEIQTFIVNSIDVIIGEGVVWIATVVWCMLMNWRVAVASLAPLLVVYFCCDISIRGSSRSTPPRASGWGYQHPPAGESLGRGGD